MIMLFVDTGPLHYRSQGDSSRSYWIFLDLFIWWFC